MTALAQPPEPGPAPLVSIRFANSDDRRLIRSSWFESYRNSPEVARTPWDIYREGCNARIDAILADPDTQTLVSFYPPIPDEIIGWSCRTGAALHWVYVKAAYRRHGAGLLLLAPIGGKKLERYTHEAPRAWMRAFLLRLGLTRITKGSP